MGILDGLRRSGGTSTPVEQGEARRLQDEIRSSKDPRDVFASSVATAVTDASPDQSARMFPSAHTMHSSSPDEMRWKHAAGEARKLADQALQQPVPGLDALLSREVGRRGLMDAAKEIDIGSRHRFTSDIRIEEVLHERRTAVADNVRAFMSVGTAADENAHMLVRHGYHLTGRTGGDMMLSAGRIVDRASDMDERSLLRAAHAHLASAHVGAISPASTVEAAMTASTIGRLKTGSIAPSPNRSEVARMSPQERASLVRRQMETTLGVSKPKTEPEQTSKGNEARRTSHSGMAAFHQAAAARAASDVGRTI